MSAIIITITIIPQRYCIINITYSVKLLKQFIFSYSK